MHRLQEEVEGEGSIKKKKGNVDRLSKGLLTAYENNILY